MNILLTYPGTVNSLEDFTDKSGKKWNTEGCTVVAGKTTSDPNNCKKIEGSRLIKITNAIPANHDGDVKIIVNLRNPSDNWGTIGVKIKTYEADTKTNEEFLADILEGNQLIPLLKCNVPCKFCKSAELIKSGKEVKENRDYCTECWGVNFPK